MEQIHTDQFEKILPLFEFDFPNRTMFLAFVEGQTPGVAFVDNSAAPTGCLVTVGFNNLTFVGGKPGQRWLDQAFAQLRKDEFLLLTWADWAANPYTSPPNPTERIKRYEFLDSIHAFDQSRLMEQLPKDHHFRRMNQELLMRCEWESEMTKAYGTPENFLRYGFGFCLMQDDEICSEAYAAFRAAGRYEIGVITPEKHRRRGYAYLACAYLVAECAKSHHQTSWSCNQENVASVATAQKLGYQTQREYQLLYYAQNP